MEYEHIIKDEYVLTPVRNAFNGRTSYWISKKGFTIALYAFSAADEAEASVQVKEFDSYIRMFKERAEKTANLRIIGRPGFISKVTIGDREFFPNEEIPCSSGDIVVLHHSPERFWDFFGNDSKIRRMGAGGICYFTVPPYAEGDAELFIRNGLEDYLYDAVRLDRSAGWVTGAVFGN